MENYPEDLRDLLQTEFRIRIYETIMAQTGQFTSKEMVKILEQEGLTVSDRFVREFLKDLYQKKYLVASFYREHERRGAFEKRYEVARKSNAE